MSFKSYIYEVKPQRNFPKIPFQVYVVIELQKIDDISEGHYFYFRRLRGSCNIPEVREINRNDSYDKIKKEVLEHTIQELIKYLGKQFNSRYDKISINDFKHIEVKDLAPTKDFKKGCYIDLLKRVKNPELKKKLKELEDKAPPEGEAYFIR